MLAVAFNFYKGKKQKWLMTLSHYSDTNNPEILFIKFDSNSMPAILVTESLKSLEAFDANEWENC